MMNNRNNNLSETVALEESVRSRRLFLKGLACSALVASSGLSGVANAASSWSKRPRKLAFYNLHTDEKLALTYFENGRYVSGAMREFNHLLRDHRSGDAISMDHDLLNFLHDLQSKLDTDKTIQIISAYRSPSTNAMLNKRSNGVAKKSLHMQGKAMDIRIEGIDSRFIQKASIAMQRGGVGYYQRSDFVHIDTGKVRSW